MKTKDELVDLINWDKVLAAPRYSGGHEEVTEATFDGVATIAAHHVQDDYDGYTACMWDFGEGGLLLCTDSFGSCSGCDAYECATHDEIRELVTSTVTSGRQFRSIDEAIQWIDAMDDAADYHFRAAKEEPFMRQLLEYAGDKR